MVTLISMKEFLANERVPAFNKRHKRICVENAGDLIENDYLADIYPHVDLRSEILNTAAHKLSAVNTSGRSLIVPVSESALKRVIRTYFEYGFNEALDVACAKEMSADCAWISHVGKKAKFLLNGITSLKQKIFPNGHKITLQDRAKISETRDWINSHVRYIAWHPHFFKLAIAGCDDIVRVYMSAAHSRRLLKYPTQTLITCMAWRPYAAQLVVGCDCGMLLWTVDGTSAYRTTSHYELFKHPNNLPITSVQWNEDGTLLATASLGDRAITLWNVDTNDTQRMRRVGPSCSFLKWSPDGITLFSATVGQKFRLWDIDNNWQTDNWIIKTGTVQTVCWSNCSNFLLFATATEPVLYCLRLDNAGLFKNGDNKRVVELADLSQTLKGNLILGGLVQQVIWDDKCCFLVVSFKHSNCIAVFYTSITKYDVNVSPAFYITGQHPLEFPNFICFQNSTEKNQNTILTIGWSTGRIQFQPFE